MAPKAKNQVAIDKEGENALWEWCKKFAKNHGMAESKKIASTALREKTGHTFDKYTSQSLTGKLKHFWKLLQNTEQSVVTNSGKKRGNGGKVYDDLIKKARLGGNVGNDDDDDDGKY